MRLPRPSLVRRLTWAFILSQAIALMLFIVALWPLARIDHEDHVGPDVAVAMLSGDLVRGPEGGLALRAGARIEALARDSAGLWYLARAGERELAFGPVPERVRTLLAVSPGVIKTADLRNVGSKDLYGLASIDEVETEAGAVVVAAGGVRGQAITFGRWLRFLEHDAYYLIPLFIALFNLLGGLIAIPLVIRTLRPTVAAASSVGPLDLAHRLPERRVVKELLPIVRAFNAALDRLAEAFERRRRFIADVAHELRTPLAVLNMHVDALEEGGKKPDLQRSVYRLGQMIGQMLDAERLSLAAARRERVDLVGLSKEVVAEVAPLAVSNGYDVGLVAEREEVVVEGDHHAIARAVSNLLGNAIAHGGGSGMIEVRVGRDGSVVVADQGPGIPAEAHERIFEPFRRERWDKDGCGLGLHLVREIMTAHGGGVALVGSAVGAAFRLHFPLARQAS